MRFYLDFTARRSGLRFALPALSILLTLAFAAAATERQQFAPKFVPGEVLRYGIESRTTTTSKITTPINNPEAGTQSKRAIHLVIRLDVLDARQADVPGGAAVRLRATYEKSSADSQSDSFDPDAAKLGDLYSGLEGHAFQFTIGSGGDIVDFMGLDDAFRDRSTAEPVLAWLQNISPAAALPPGGIAVGQKWKSERPVPGAPLEGLIWQTESTYLHDEPCGSPADGSAPPKAAPADGGMCASILTHFEIVRRGGSEKSDATPEDYRRNGLRTSGTWTGSGESLDSVSLATALLVSSTETSTQNIDYKIMSATAKSTIHRTGKIETQSEITLMPDEPAASK